MRTAICNERFLLQKPKSSVAQNYHAVKADIRRVCTHVAIGTIISNQRTIVASFSAFQAEHYSRFEILEKFGVLQCVCYLKVCKLVYPIRVYKQMRFIITF